MEANEGGELRGKFPSRLAEALYRMTLDGWNNESSGDVQAPTGWFARISVTPEELQEVAEAMEEELVELGLDPTELVGHRIITEDNYGFVSVDEYDTEAEAKFEYARLEIEYDEWESDGGVQ